jgi:hypothetical protein
MQNMITSAMKNIIGIFNMIICYAWKDCYKSIKSNVRLANISSYYDKNKVQENSCML